MSKHGCYLLKLNSIQIKNHINLIISKQNPTLCRTRDEELLPIAGRCLGNGEIVNEHYTVLAQNYGGKL